MFKNLKKKLKPTYAETNKVGGHSYRIPFSYVKRLFGWVGGRAFERGVSINQGLL
jgi:hypothetical protein